MTAKKSTPAAEPCQLLPQSELPQEVTVSLKLHDKKYMALRQYIGQGEIEGHKLALSYNIANGGPIVTIGDFTYEGDWEKIVPQIMAQIVPKALCTTEAEPAKTILTEREQAAIDRINVVLDGDGEDPESGPGAWADCGEVDVPILLSLVARLTK